MTPTQVGTKLGIRKITARIGAEITGLSPDLILDSGTVAAVRAALNEHKALVFRGVRLDDEDQQRFAGYFGPLTSAHPTVPAVDGEPNVLPVDSEDGRVNYWHTDVTFVLNPPQASTLRSVIVPPYGGETLIASTGAAYRDLPAPRTFCGSPGSRVSWCCSTTGSPSTTPWTTTMTRPAGCTASPWPATSRSASTAAPAIPSRATPPTTPRSPPSSPPRNQ